MMPKVSVIVPVFNAEKFIESCIASILNQSVKDIELIIVNDGSTDATPSICNSYSKKDKRIKVINQQNSRAAAARNAGLMVATGEYVSFIDADDWIDPRMYEIMLAQAVDVCLCDYLMFKEKEESAFSHTNVEGGFYSKERIKGLLFPSLVMDKYELPITASNCVMLIKRKVLVENALIYNTRAKVCEDIAFGSKVLYHADSFFYFKGEYLYHYRITPGSTSKTFKPFWWDSFLEINEELESYFGNSEEYDFGQQICANMFYFACLEMNMVLESQSLSWEDKNKSLKEIMNHSRVRRMIKNYNCTGDPLSIRCIYWSLRYRSILLRRLVSVASAFKKRMKRA